MLEECVFVCVWLDVLAKPLVCQVFVRAHRQTRRGNTELHRRRLATARATRQSHGTRRFERRRRRGGEGRAIRWHGVAAERWELRRRGKGAEDRGAVWAVSSSVGMATSTRAALRGALHDGPGRCAASVQAAQQGTDS